MKRQSSGEDLDEEDLEGSQQKKARDLESEIIYQVVSREEMIDEPFSLLGEELHLQIGMFLSAKDLLSFQSTAKDFNKLPTDRLWKTHCEERWKSWPRYQWSEERKQELETALPNSSWQQKYMFVEEDATRMNLTKDDLTGLKWYLSFVLSGIRGEGRTDHMEVTFTPQGYLLVPGYPPLAYEIMEGTAPGGNDTGHIRSNLRGDRPFSNNQYLKISDHFPPHFITRKAIDAEWLVVNENVMIVSCKP